MGCCSMSSMCLCGSIRYATVDEGVESLNKSLLLLSVSSGNRKIAFYAKRFWQLANDRELPVSC
jgi:hypothetical protein